MSQRFAHCLCASSVVLLIFSLALSIPKVACEQTAGDDADHVLVLTDLNFEAETAKHDSLLVEFYAPWCGHCKRLEPEYREAAAALAKDGIIIAKMDADAEKKIPGKFGVSGFPTLKLFRNGEFAEDFDGGRTAADIITYAKKKAEAAVNKEVTTLSTLKTLTSAKTVTRTTLVGFFPDKSGIDYKYFKQVVAQFADVGIDIYHTSAPNVLEGFGFFGSQAAIQMYRPDAKPFKVSYRGTIFKQQLREWILKSAIPAVGHYDPENQKLYQMIPESLVRFVAESPRAAVDIKKFVPALAEKYKDRVVFATSNLGDYKADVEAQCDKGAKICVLAQEGKKLKGGRLFGMSGAYSEQAVEQFIEDFLAKKLKTRVKSEAAPTPAKAGAVVTLVGSTFESEVVNSEKDVFIKFYAPWCGHCKRLAPTWDELAKELADSFDTLAIAKFDLTTNDVPQEYKGSFNVEGFPTLYFAKRGAKAAPLKYEGGRELADLKKWIEENRSK